MATGSPLTIGQAARRAAAWEWAEGRLYQVAGSWARASAAASCKLYFDSASQHHAWRARLWHERLRGRLVQAYSAGADGGPAVQPLGQAGPPSSDAEQAALALLSLEGDAGRVAAHCRVVLSRSVAGYRAWQEVCGPSADRPIARALGMALADVVADWQEGSKLLSLLLDRGGGPALKEAVSASAGADAALFGWGFW